ncbi:hypothetical protein NC652_039231 [Populus alba x Populus x berolinensis]|nr:hypothetical protein NC652_039216 [Populus alba x Populus x berolinensis]KAJ6862319.1 hypothetical protein NC652_039227 [Populus alba x Populus x berolinensis]KAJ6862323.1 hypothetical protein NC652_039231 [Populus alba x Populus x berolinensis]
MILIHLSKTIIKTHDLHDCSLSEFDINAQDQDSSISSPVMLKSIGR